MSVRRNPALLCVFRAAQMSLFPIAVVTIFWQQEIGLGMLEIFTLQSIFAGTMGVLELPSGYLADRIGYRRVLILAALVTVAGWTVYLFSPDFWTLVVAEVLLGVGLSLASGTDSAMLYESLLETGREAEFARWNGRVRASGQIAEGSAALVAGLLYVASPRLPFLLEVVVWLGGAGVALALVEPARHRTSPARALVHMADVTRRLLKGAPRLQAVVTLTVALTLCSFAPVWIIQIYNEAAGVPLAWLGPIWAAANYVVAVGSLSSDRLGRALGTMPVLAVCIAMVAVGYLGLGLTHAWWGFVFYFLITGMRGINYSLLHHEEQRLIPSADRATFLSLRSLIFRLVWVGVAPCIGWAIDERGSHEILLVLGAVFSTLSAAGWLWLRGAMREPGPS